MGGLQPPGTFDAGLGRSNRLCSSLQLQRNPPSGSLPNPISSGVDAVNSQSCIRHGNAAAARGRGSTHMAGEPVPCRTEVTVQHASCSCRLTAGGWLLSVNRSLPPACSRLGSHGAGTFALPGGHLGERACPSMKMAPMLCQPTAHHGLLLFIDTDYRIWRVL